MKILFRRLLKLPLVAGSFTQLKRQPGVNMLIYHSVTNQLRLELDLPYVTFQRQLEFLAQTNQVIGYDQAVTRLKTGRSFSKDSYVLTFDDGYADFYTAVFPLLRRLQLPAILFINTGFVETRVPYPLLPQRRQPVKPVSWDMLGEMVVSGLVTLGAHTHTHPELITVPPSQVEEELSKPIQLIKQRLGITVNHFAYPRALWNENVERLVSQYYHSAVIGGGYKATTTQFHPYRIPRIPIRRSDGWLFFRAKMQGWLANEEQFYQKFRITKSGSRQKVAV